MIISAVSAVGRLDVGATAAPPPRRLRRKDGAQQVVGIDVETGEDRWDETIETCGHHASGLISGTMFMMPSDTDGKQWDIKTIDDDETVLTAALDDLWVVRDDRLLTVEDDAVVATSYPEGSEVWDTEVCPDSTGYESFGRQDKNRDDVTAPAVIVTCGDDSQRVLDSRDGQSAELPETMDDDILVQATPETLVTVQQVDDRVVATHLLSEQELWNQAKPSGDLHIGTTPKYAIVSLNESSSRNMFSVVVLTTGEEHSHSPAWGDWSAGSAGSQGVWVTHRSLCIESYSCKLNSTYLLD